MILNFDKYYRPCNDVVFAVMFGHKNLFCRLNEAVHQKKIDIEGEPHSQATMREDDVLLNSIRFDVFAKEKAEQTIYSIDIQRKYYHARLERRGVYYVCRAVSTQPVDKMEYEDLKPVHITFMLTEKNARSAVRHVGLCYLDTGEPYDDLIDLVLVFVPAAAREADRSSDLYVFARFFSIESKKAAQTFTAEFENNELAKELVSMYNTAVANRQHLQDAENRPYFLGRLTEAQLKEERQRAERKGIEKGIEKGIKKGIEKGVYRKAVITAQKMLANNEPIDKIANYTDLDPDTVRTIALPK